MPLVEVFLIILSRTLAEFINIDGPTLIPPKVDVVAAGIDTALTLNTPAGDSINPVPILIPPRVEVLAIGSV